MTQSIADELARLPMSPILGTTLTRAADLARDQGHARVSLEHVLLALTEDADAGPILQASGVAADRVGAEVATHLAAMPPPPSAEGAPLSLSPELKRVLEGAAAAAQQVKRQVSGAIVLAAIVGDGKSAAAHILRGQGLTFEHAIKALQQSARPPAGARPRPQQPAPQPQPPPQSGPPGGAPSPPPPALQSPPPPPSRSDSVPGPFAPAPAARSEASAVPPPIPVPAAGPPRLPSPPAPAIGSAQSGPYRPEWTPAALPAEVAADAHIDAPPMPAAFERQPAPPQPPPQARSAPPPAAPPPPAAAQGAPAWGGEQLAPPPHYPSGHAHAPAPQHWPPPDAAQIERQRALVPAEQPSGQLIETIPRSMRVGLAVPIEVRLVGQDGPAGPSPAERRPGLVTRAMSVRLLAPDGGFRIDAGAPETQWIESGSPGAGQALARWRWTVTPEAAGKSRLILAVSARWVGPDGVSPEAAAPAQLVAVTVRQRWGRLTARALGWTALGLALVAIGFAAAGGANSTIAFFRALLGL